MTDTDDIEPDYFATQVLSARRFYIALAPSKGKTVRVVSGGCEICAPNYSVSRPGFPFLTLELVVKGEGELTLDGASYSLTPGTAYIYGEGVSHHIQSHQRKGLTKYFIAVTGSDAMQWLDEAGLCLSSVFRVRGLVELEHLFDTLTALGRGDSNTRARLCNATFQYLLIRMGELSTGYTEGETVALATYQRCRKVIEANYLRFHTVREIAAACHLAPEYLCRLFRRFRRQTPFQYLQSLKMNRAVELLREGHYSVKQVALQVGFPDPYHFSRAFKRIYGLPPVKLISVHP